MVYNRRAVDGLLDALLPGLPAILLDGPKGVGKTTTALQRAKTVRRLDIPAERLLAQADVEQFARGPKPILLDEWQLEPQLWGVVKRAVDADFAGGQFILTGSMPNPGTHSGAGRITSLRMRPLSFAERYEQPAAICFGDLLSGSGSIAGETTINFENYCEELLRSGFPALRILDGRQLRQALDGYIERIIDADLDEVGLRVKKPATLRAWLAAYAAATSTTARWETIRDAANFGSSESPSRGTVIPYRDALTRLRILDELPAWLPSRNRLLRVSQASKHYLADPALAMRLMDYDATSIRSAEQFGALKFDAPLLGRMFEALAVLSIRTYAEANFATAMHFRDTDGRHEVDMIIKRDDGKVIAIEVKLGETVTEGDFKHLKWLKREIGDELIDSIVVYSGKHAYRQDGIAVIPLAMLGV